MKTTAAKLQLNKLFKELGVQTSMERSEGGSDGFPLRLAFGDGTSVILDLPDPGPLSGLDPEQIGLAVIDPLGQAQKCWGLAQKIPLFQAGRNILNSPISKLLDVGATGAPVVLYEDGHRFYGASVPCDPETPCSDVIVVVTNASDEQRALREASRSDRFARALKRLGKVFTMNHSTSQICLSAAHEIASAAELAAILIWTPSEDPGTFSLLASIGVNRLGVAALGDIHPGLSSACAAELVASTHLSFCQTNLHDHVLTASLEAKFCYLRPGGICVHPLIFSENVLGVVEFIGREGDTYFAEHGELFETFAEHLALALNAAMLFETAEKRASHDALTGIANHRTMQEFLHRRVSEAARVGQEIGVVMIDVDHFRSFNEEEGHDVGDQVLRLVSDVLATSVRPYDLAARYGGEEFAVILPGSNREATEFAAERIRSRIEGIPFVTPSGRERHVSASLGCAMFPTNGNDAGQVLKAADNALFSAKKAGRNRVHFYEGQPDGSVSEAVLAIDADSLVLPQFKEASRVFQENSAEDLRSLAQRLPLSKSQEEILRALVLMVFSYQYMCRHDRRVLKKLEKSTDFRLLRPSLVALEERHDGKGPHGMKGTQIPLLARILQVLLAFQSDGGEAIADDPGRFDPEIVSAVLDIRHAA